MFSVERRKEILDKVKNNGSISVKVISKKYKVSLVTARKDLDILASKGLLIRTRGGAVMTDLGTSYEPSYFIKRKIHHSAKSRIGIAAAKHVKDGQTLIIDSGSTSYNMVNHIKNLKNITVITYDLIIATELSTNSNVTVIIAGGTVRNNLFSTWGPLTLSALEKFKVNKTFLTADAVDLDQGLTNATIDGVPTKKTIIQAAEEIILLADYSKFGHSSLAKVAPIEDVDLIISDKSMPIEIKNELEARDIIVQLV